MVGKTSPHAYSRELANKGGSLALLKEIRQVDHLVFSADAVPIYSLTHLSIVARVPYEAARDVIFNHRAHYSARKLTKRSGQGFRRIHEPSPQLKSLHRAILHNCLPKRPTSDLAFAYESGRNTLAAARRHIGAKTVIQVDLSDFFGSISSSRIYSVFAELGYPKLLALEMAIIIVGRTRGFT